MWIQWNKSVVIITEMTCRLRLPSKLTNWVKKRTKNCLKMKKESVLQWFRLLSSSSYITAVSSLLGALEHTRRYYQQSRLWTRRKIKEMLWTGREERQRAEIHGNGVKEKCTEPWRAGSCEEVQSVLVKLSNHMVGIWAGFGGDFYSCFYSLERAHYSNERVPSYTCQCTSFQLMERNKHE